MRTNETIKNATQLKQPQIMCTDELANKKLLLVLFNYNANFVKRKFNKSVAAKNSRLLRNNGVIALFNIFTELRCESKHY